MAETPERDQRTEEPTPHRLEEARRKGQVASSKEPAQALLLVASLAWLSTIVPEAGVQFLREGAVLLREAALAGDLGSIDLGVLTRNVVRTAALMLAPLCVLVIATPILSAFAQRSIVLAGEKLAPDLSRLDPMKGVGRLLSAQNLVEFVKATLKVVVAVAIAVLLLRREVGTIAGTSEMPLGDAIGVMVRLVTRLLVAMAGIGCVIAAIDVVWQYIAWRNNLRMTRQELKDELKSTEGHPEIKAKIKAIQRERARSRMLADVPKAAVVITNPTHVAVALGYDGATEPVPRVLAKGRDVMAAKIRAAAEAARVPLVSDPPVARALHASVEVGEVIKAEHYKAVAGIISYVLQRRRGESARMNPDR